MYNVILIDNERETAPLVSYLSGKSYKVRSAENINEALQMLAVFSPNCIVIGAVLSSGPSLMEFARIRKLTSAPIIVLSATDGEESSATAFRMGADDFVVKPQTVKLLELRIAARIRGSNGILRSLEEQMPEELIIDIKTRTVVYKGRMINLTGKEFAILAFLAGNEGTACSLEEIYSAVWGIYKNGNPLTVQSHVSNLRKKMKLGCDGNEFVRTAWGNGYRFSRNLTGF